MLWYTAHSKRFHSAPTEWSHLEDRVLYSTIKGIVPHGCDPVIIGSTTASFANSRRHVYHQGTNPFESNQIAIRQLLVKPPVEPERERDREREGERDVNPG